MSRKALLVDADYGTLASLGAALRARGFEVTLAADGRTGLDRAVLALPDVIIVDAGIPIVDASTFLDILASNPRTSETPVFVVGGADVPDVRRAPSKTHQAFFRKPFQVGEVAARVEALLLSRDKDRDRRGEPAELRGDLSQVTLPDLLQVFAMNRRTGVLAVATPVGTGEIAIRDGFVADAIFGPVSGVKALYRLLAIRSGRFLFHPGRTPAVERISGATEALLVEGMRQLDEHHRLPVLPRDTTVARVEGAPRPKGLHEAQAQIWALIATPRPVGQLLDAADATDFEAARAILALVDAGFARIDLAGPTRVPIGDADFRLALRKRLAQGGRTTTLGARLLLGARRGGAAKAFEALGGVEEFVGQFGIEGIEAGAALLGTAGTLALPEGGEIGVCILPMEPGFRPLWGAFASGTIGVIVLDDGEATREPCDDAARFARDTLGVTAIIAGPRASEPPWSVEADWTKPAGLAAAVQALVANFPSEGGR